MFVRYRKRGRTTMRSSCILKLLPDEILKQYKWKKELRFQYKKYKIHYIDKRKLTISKGNHSISCYDIAQYYNKQSLDVASESIGISLDQEYLNLKKKRSEFSKFYYSRHKREIRTQRSRHPQRARASPRSRADEHACG